MTEHARQIIAAEELPPTDSAAEIEAVSKTADGEAFDPATGELIGNQPTQTEEPQAAPEAPKVELIDGLDPETDIALVVSRGHVNIARAQQITTLLTPVAMSAAFVAVVSLAAAVVQTFSPFIGASAFFYWIKVGLLVLCFGSYLLEWARNRSVLLGPILLVPIAAIVVLNIAQYPSGRQLYGEPGFVSSLFTFDRDTYFDLGGGLRGGPDFRWMADYKPMPESLSVADYGRLTDALSKDIAAKGMEAAEWSNVAELVKAPIITRGEKAILEHGDKLKTGVVVVPHDLRIVAVLAHVEGKWSAAVVGGGNCTVLLGPAPQGCRDNNNPDNWQAGDFRMLIERFEIKTAEAAQE